MNTTKISNYQIDGLVQDYSNCIANALDSLQSCIKALKYKFGFLATLTAIH